MTGQQHAVMWMGLLLIVLRMFTTVQWTEIKSVMGMGAAPATTSPSSSNPVGGILGNIGKDLVSPVLGLIPGAGPLIPGATPTEGSHG